VTDLASVRTPVFVIDAAIARANVAEVLRRVGAPSAWRAHVKTARSEWGYRLLLDAGVSRFKCSTVEELGVLLGAGARDVLLAFPAVGPMQEAVIALAARHPDAAVSVLVDSVAAMDTWAPGPLDVFLDLDTGMHRTGVPVADAARLLELATEVTRRGHRLRGLHAYDGHLADVDAETKRAQVGRDLRALALRAHELEAAGLTIGEVVTGSTHTFDDVLAHSWTGPGARTIGPGTVLYNDVRAMTRFGEDSGFRVAAGVLTRVVSVEGDRVTTDAGLTAVQVDAGRPHLRVEGFEVVSASQEHLVLRNAGSPAVVGDLLQLRPAHVDTAIVQFDRLLVVDGAEITEVESVGRWSRDV